MEVNKIEYADKSLLKEKQRNEIEKSLFKQQEPNIKLNSMLRNIFIGIVIILVILFLVSICINNYIMALTILLCTFMMGTILLSLCFNSKSQPEDYMIIKGTVLNKWRLKSGRYVEIVVGDEKYEMSVIFDIYYVLKLNEERIYVVSFSDKNNIYSGTLLLDITDILEENKEK